MFIDRPADDVDSAGSRIHGGSKPPPCGWSSKQKAPDNCLSRTKKLPRCHLASRFDPCPLRSACTLPDHDGVPPSHDTRCLSHAPSAVHLMRRFPPGSQPPGLSVGSFHTVISASTVLFG